MGKTYTYVVMAITIMLVMTFVGLQTGFTNIFNVIGFQYNNATGNISSVDIQSSNFYQSLFNWDIGILLAVIGGSIAIGLLARFTGENLVLLPFVTGTLVLFVQTFAGIINSVIEGTYPTWLAAVVVTVFLPITIGLVITLAEWFRGTDN
jgi:hypothetical protein